MALDKKILLGLLAAGCAVTVAYALRSPDRPAPPKFAPPPQVAMQRVAAPAPLSVKPMPPPVAFQMPKIPAAASRAQQPAAHESSAPASPAASAATASGAAPSANLDLPSKLDKDFASRPIKEMRAPTMAALGQILAPYTTSNAEQPPDNPDAAAAFGILKDAHLAGPPVATPPATGLGQKLGDAMMLGSRWNQFLPELAKLDDALPQGGAAAKDAAAGVWQKAGRTPPSSADMSKMLGAAADARASVMQPPQHGGVAGVGGQNIQVDTSPAAGLARASVFTTGADGQPERVTFGGHSETQVQNGDLQPGLAPDQPPRVVTQADSENQRNEVNGTWTDQDGKTWEISGSGDAITFVQGAASGHQMAYAGNWSLGLPTATHIVADPADIADDLPGDVRAGLASDWHPPFSVRLEYRADNDQFEGVWISGVVTYSGMGHTIKMVEDPTWDKPLVLHRDDVDSAYGARSDEHL